VNAPISQLARVRNALAEQRTQLSQLRTDLAQQRNDLNWEGDINICDLAKIAGSADAGIAS
jgi:hypothetical protein